MAKPQISAVLAAVTWVLLAIVLLLAVVRTGHPLGDFDYSTGLVRCGVAGLSPSCGSVVP